MTRTALLGMALALVITGGAFAQTPPAPGAGETLPPPPELAPPPPPPAADANAQAAPGDEAAGEPTAAEALRHAERTRQRDERRARRQAMRQERRDRFDRDDEGWSAYEEDPDEQVEVHHPGMMGHRGMRPRGPQGAVFRFSRGSDGPSIVIRCADRDTTQECVDAVGPMLQMMLPNAR